MQPTESTANDYSSFVDSDSDLDDQDNYLYHLFKEAVVSPNWIETEFHNYCFEKYTRPIFKSFDEKSYTPVEWVHCINHLLKWSIYPEGIMVVRDIEKRVGTCATCNKTRTISKIVSLNKFEYYVGKNCATKLINVVNFYTEMFVNREESISFYSSIMSNLNSCDY